MIPKVIYVHTRTKPHIEITFSEVKEKNCTNDKYVSVDYLLEFFKEKQNIALQEADKSGDNYDYGVATGIASTIDKLNSL